MSDERNPDSKVRISTTREGETEHETLWATSLGDDLFVLDNSPFYAYDVSWGDTVRAVKIEDSEIVQFQEVVKRSGNKTIRIIFDGPVGPGTIAQQISDILNQMGCSYEGVSPHFLAFNIPPDVELESVTSMLEGQPLQWEHADPSYNTLYPGW